MNPMFIRSGLRGVDLIIGGGFKKGSLVIVAGNPGTGKTVFSAGWLYHGAEDFDESGIYVSFAESRETFYDNMKSFGYYFKKLEDEGKFQFLDLLTVRYEGVSDVFNWILDKVYSLKAKRLVIDSFSALAQAFEKPIDVRTFIHTILSKILRKTGCTTLLILEVPYGEEKIGYGIEEFLADAVLLLKKREYEGVPLREISILKNRWSEIIQTDYVFTLKEGFQIFPPLSIKPMKRPIGRYEVIPHKRDSFSTGIRDLDEILRGSFRGGGYNLLEIEKDVAFPLERLISPISCNFLNQGHGVVILPPQGISSSTVEKAIVPFIDPEYRENLVITGYKGEGYGIVTLKGKSLEEDMKQLWKVTSDLREKTGKPVFSVVGFDTIEYNYGEREALKILGEDVARIRNYEDLRLNIIRPTIHVADNLEALSDIHLRIEMIHGALFIRGIKPKTTLLGISFETSGEYSKIKLTPVI
ncbi:AAA family ATPase [Candidatus Bathyarchaeota archaeon]|nr:AAA family ATPase [Candidatus Bathyarchaeota archaeon]